jgi:hypothetical protein
MANSQSTRRRDRKLRPGTSAAMLRARDPQPEMMP